MSLSVPNYFYQLFSSVHRLEEYFKIPINELNIPKPDKEALLRLSENILIVIPQDLTCIYNAESFDKRITDLNDASIKSALIRL